MKKKIIPALISAFIVFHSAQSMANQGVHHTTSDEEHLSAGVGAASGALIAGPVGFILGGLVGVLYSHDGTNENNAVAELEAFDELTTDKLTNETTQVETSADDSVVVAALDDDEIKRSDDLILASASDNDFLIKHETDEKPDRLKTIITDNLNFVVHFTPGSVTTEPFYKEQFDTVLSFLQAMPEVELNLAGYSDRRGTEDENIQLASKRVSSIREYFIQQGISENRIKVHAYGEKHLLSTSGELDSYMFDRRVVLSFNVSQDVTQNNLAIAAPVSSEEQPQTSPF